jgi:hypothetical protein
MAYNRAGKWVNDEEGGEVIAGRYYEPGSQSRNTTPYSPPPSHDIWAKDTPADYAVKQERNDPQERVDERGRRIKLYPGSAGVVKYGGIHADAETGVQVAYDKNGNAFEAFNTQGGPKMISRTNRPEDVYAKVYQEGGTFFKPKLTTTSGGEKLQTDDMGNMYQPNRTAGGTIKLTPGEERYVAQMGATKAYLDEQEAKRRSQKRGRR